nr:hypothetical protein [Alkalihalobacillus deserti]
MEIGGSFRVSSIMDAKTGRVLGMEQNRSYESTQLLLTKNVLSHT